MIIPTLNAANGLKHTIDALSPAVREGLISEVLVADGGSVDDTRAQALAAGGRIVDSARGRGVQLATGGNAASGDWLMFLHADTVLEPGWERAVRDFIAKPASKTRAAAFRFRLDDDSRVARRMEKIVAWRCSWFGLPYGDQGLVISREFYDRLGGYRPFLLMEDVDLVRRIGRRRLEILEARAITSAAKYGAAGYGPRTARNLTCLLLYYLKVPPRLIVRLYY
ncbi:MAG: TIGR04283 family arsenosugar biosynthesis glycosyltransferase [Sphingomonadales bacterium]